MSEGAARVVSVDLGWSEATKGRNAAAFLTPTGRIRFDQSLPSEDSALSSFLRSLVPPRAPILLDIPIEGGDHLAATGRAFREIDYALLRARISLYPSARAVGRGERLGRLLGSHRVHETYPYAILRVLWALLKAGKLSRAIGGSDEALLDESAWRIMPPRYKRGTQEERRRALEAVYGLLTSPDLGLPFDPELPRPVRGASLSALSDLYDACVGLLPAYLTLRNAGTHSLVGIAAGRGGGAILLLADPWLRERMGRAVEWTPFRVE